MVNDYLVETFQTLVRNLYHKQIKMIISSAIYTQRQEIINWIGQELRNLPVNISASFPDDREDQSKNFCLVLFS